MRSPQLATLTQLRQRHRHRHLEQHRERLRLECCLLAVGTSFLQGMQRFCTHAHLDLQPEKLLDVFRAAQGVE